MIGLAVMGGGGFIRELCIALAHRWRAGRLFMILTSYFDESGTHDGSPVTIMAGILATAGQWDRFQKELNRIKHKYGFKIFHSKDFKSRSGEFKGWSREKCLALLTELVDISSKSFMQSTVFTLNNAEFEREYKSGDNPRKLRLDTKYGLAFRYCLTSLTAEAIDRLRTHKRFPQTRMHVVLESGHQHCGDAQRVFTELQRELEAHGCSLLDTITFARKREGDPLMIADFLAYTSFVVHRRGHDPSVFAVSPGKRSGVLHMDFEPGQLAVLKTSLIERLNSRRGAGGRAAVGASE